MLYDMELDLNEYFKGKEQIFKQILLQLSIIEGYQDDLCALICVLICCPAVLKFFSSKMVLIDLTGHILAFYSNVLDQMSILEGYSTIAFAPQIVVT